MGQVDFGLDDTATSILNNTATPPEINSPRRYERNMPFAIQLSLIDSSSSMVEAIRSKTLPRGLEIIQPLKSISETGISEIIAMGMDAQHTKIFSQPMILLDIVEAVSFAATVGDEPNFNGSRWGHCVDSDKYQCNEHRISIEFIWPFEVSIDLLSKIQRSVSKWAQGSIFDRVSASNREITKSDALLLAPIVTPRSVDGGVIYLRSSLPLGDEVDVPYHLLSKYTNSTNKDNHAMRSSYSELLWNFDQRSQRPKEELMLWTDVARRSLIKIASNFDHGKFFGKSLDGSVSRGHRHAHFVAESDENNKIKSIILYAPDKIPQAIVESATRITRLNTTIPNRGSVSVKIASVLLENSKVSSASSEKTTYRSITPYVPIRHRHKNQTTEDFLLNDIKSELSERDMMCTPRNLRILGNFTDERYLLRAKEGRGAETSGWRIEFVLDRQIDVRLSLGRFSHFGMGLFTTPG